MDYFLFQKINSLAGRWLWLDALAIFFAAYFQYFLSAALVLLAAVKKEKATRIRNLKVAALAFLSAFISRFVFAEIIKRLAARPRPFEAHEATRLLLDKSSDDSFPSGHMAFFFALSAVVYLCIRKSYPAHSWWVGLILFGGSFLIGLSRMFVGIHYPSDILGGAALGLLVGWLVVKIYDKIVRKKIHEQDQNQK